MWKKQLTLAELWVLERAVENARLARVLDDKTAQGRHESSAYEAYVERLNKWKNQK